VRTKVFVFIGAAAGTTEPVAEALRQGGQSEAAKQGPEIAGWPTLSFWDASPELDQLKASLAEHGIEWDFRKELVFSERELREATLLRMIIARSPKSSGGAAAGTTYAPSTGCPQCGTGATQTSALILRKAQTPTSGKMFITARERLVATEVAHFLNEQMVTGVHFREAVAWRTGEPLGWHQIMPAHEMPPWSPATTGGTREKPCPRCHRDGHFDSLTDPLRITYQASDLDIDSLPDITSTWECFGKSWITPPSEKHTPLLFASPLLLVRPRVRALLRESGVTRLKYEPVAILGS
jgi:hypothetical protein